MDDLRDLFQQSEGKVEADIIDFAQNPDQFSLDTSQREYPISTNLDWTNRAIEQLRRMLKTEDFSRLVEILEMKGMNLERAVEMHLLPGKLLGLATIEDNLLFSHKLYRACIVRKENAPSFGSSDRDRAKVGLTLLHIKVLEDAIYNLSAEGLTSFELNEDGIPPMLVELESNLKLLANLEECISSLQSFRPLNKVSLLTILSYLSNEQSKMFSDFRAMRIQYTEEIEEKEKRKIDRKLIDVEERFNSYKFLFSIVVEQISES